MNEQMLKSRNLYGQRTRHSHYVTYITSYKQIISKLGHLLLKNMFKKRFFGINRQVVSYLLVFLLVFQNNYAFSDEQNAPAPNSDDPEEQITEYSLESLNRLQSLRFYDPMVMLTINDASFSLMPGVYGGSSDLPLPDEHYIPHTKLGRSIEYLKDPQLMINEIYYLHNGLVGKVREIILDIRKRNGDSETVVKELRDLIDGRNNPSFDPPNNIGRAELTQIDGQLVVRVVSEKTDTVFYILNEAVISEGSSHLEKVQGRQHSEAGTNRLDGQTGRDVIFLWVDGRRNTRTTVSPRIEIKLSSLQIPIPFYQNPQNFQLAQRKHRQLLRQDRWNAIKHPITLNDLSFGSAKAVFQACLIGGIGVLQERLTGQTVNFPVIMTMAALLAFIPCSFPSAYRHWLNMGPMGFLQKREDHVTIDSHNSIDWKETANSKAVRASISSIILAYGFLASTYWDDFQNSESLWTALYLFIVINAIAIPNILLNATARVWWAEQAFVNELAGVRRGRMRLTGWSRKNFDYFAEKYFWYDMTRLFHLAGLGRLPDSISSRFSSLGINLEELGVNLGLFSLIGSYLVGKFVLLRKVLNFQQRGLLEDQQTWDYLTQMHSNLGKLLLYIEIFYRRASAFQHEQYIPHQNEEGHLDLLDLTEEEKQHLTRWQEHRQVQFSAEQELALYDVRQRISHDLAVLERDFFDAASLEVVESYRQRLRTFFNNRFEAIGEAVHEMRLLSEEELDSNPWNTWQKLSQIVTNYKNNIAEKEEEHVVMESSYRQQVRTSFGNLVKVIHGLFETLKASYISTAPDPNDNDVLHSRDVYLPFWERYSSPEQEDWFRFLEEHITEDSPSLRNSLTLMTDQTLVEDIDVEEIPEDMNVLLENLLREVESLFRNNWGDFESYIDNQEIERLRDFGPRESLDDLVHFLNNERQASMNYLRQKYGYDNMERFSQRRHGSSQTERKAYNYDIGRFSRDCPKALTAEE